MATLKVTNIKNESFAGDQLYLKTDGNIGIGTTSPAVPLHIKSNTPYVRLEDDNDNQDWQIEGRAFFSIYDVNDSAHRLVIDGDGKIGIGTSSPNHLLHVEGALSGTTGFNLTNTHASGYGLYVKGGGTGNYAFRVDNQAGNEALRIVDGKVGIGTTNPEETLDLGNATQMNLKIGGRGYIGQAYSTAATIIGHSVKAKTTGTISGGMIVTETNSGGGAPSALRMQSGNIEFHTAGSGTEDADFNSNERMRMDSNGKLLIATITPGHANADDLTIGPTTAGARGGLTINAANDKDCSIHFGDSDSNLSGQINYDHDGDKLSFYTGGTKRVRIDSDGIKFGVSASAQDALNDYEEGNYTPTFNGGTSGSYSLNGSYDNLAFTKIGRQVTVTGRVRMSAKNAASGSYIHMSLPTTSANLGEDMGRVGGLVVVQSSGSAVNSFVTHPTTKGNSYVQIGIVDGTGFGDANAQFSGDELVFVSITYQSA